MFLRKRRKLGLHGSYNRESKILCDRDRFAAGARHDQLALEFGIERILECLGIEAQPETLLDAGQNLETALNGLHIVFRGGLLNGGPLGLRQFAAGHGGGAEMTFE